MNPLASNYKTTLAFIYFILFCISLLQWVHKELYTGFCYIRVWQSVVYGSSVWPLGKSSSAGRFPRARVGRSCGGGGSEQILVSTHLWPDRGSFWPMVWKGPFLHYETYRVQLLAVRTFYLFIWIGSIDAFLRWMSMEGRRAIALRGISIQIALRSRQRWNQ